MRASALTGLACSTSRAGLVSISSIEELAGTSERIRESEGILLSTSKSGDSYCQTGGCSSPLASQCGVVGIPVTSTAFKRGFLYLVRTRRLRVLAPLQAQSL